MSLHTRLIDYLSSISGVSWIVVSRDGFPLEFKGVEREKAEEIAALLEDSAHMLDKQTSKIGARLKYFTLNIEDNREVLVTKVEDTYYILECKAGLHTTLLSVMDRISRGASVRCSICGYDLTLEKYKCPKCNSVIPFIASRCPICGEDVDVKKCPKCGTRIHSSGTKYVSPLKGARIVLAIGLVMLAILSMVTGLYMSQATGIPYPAGLGILASLMILYMAYHSGVLLRGE